MLKSENILRQILKQVKDKNNDRLKKSLYLPLALAYNTQVASSIDSYSIGGQYFKLFLSSTFKK
jgi:hypothetical protein